MKFLKLLFLIYFTFQTGISLAAPAETAKIQGNLTFLKEGEKVRLTVYRLGSFVDFQQWTNIYTASVHNHHFELEVPLNAYPQYIDIYFPSNPNKSLFGYLLSANDRIRISEQNNDLIFKGKGASSFNTQYRLARFNKEFYRRYFDTRKIIEDFSTVDSATMAKLSYIKSVKAALPAEKYNVLLADIYGDNETSKYAHLFSDYSSFKDSVNHLSTAIINHRRKNIMSHSAIPDKLKQYSRTFSEGLVEKYAMDSCILLDKPFSVGKAYRYFKEQFSGGFREQLVCTLLFTKRNSSEDLVVEISDALKWVKNTDYREILMFLKQTTVTGALAPQFSLTDISGRKIRLSNFKGKVVLMDFWFTGCGACRALSPVLKSVEEQVNNDRFTLISVSIDNDKAQWIKSVNSGKYTSEKHINVFTNGNGSNDPMIKSYNISGYPTLVLIDTSGKILPNPINPLEDNGVSLYAAIVQSLK